MRRWERPASGHRDWGQEGAGWREAKGRGRLGQWRGASERTSWRSLRISASKPCTSAWESSSSSAFSSLEERRWRGLGTRRSQPFPRRIAPMRVGLGPSPPSPFTAFRTHSSCRRRRSWALALASCRAKWCEGPSRGVLAGAAGTKGAGSRSSSSSAKRCGRAKVKGQKEPIPCPPNHHKPNLALAALLAQPQLHIWASSIPIFPTQLGPCSPPIRPPGPGCPCCPLPGPPRHAPVPVSVVSPSGSGTASPTPEVPAPRAQAQPAPAPCPLQAGSPGRVGRASRSA